MIRTQLEFSATRGTPGNFSGVKFKGGGMKKDPGFLIVCMKCQIVPKSLFIISRNEGIALQCSNCKNIQSYPFKSPLKEVDNEK